MANATDHNPWVIDTAASTVLSTDLLRISSFRWVVGTGGAVDDQCVAQDQNGKVVFEAFASAKDTEYEVTVSKEINISGLKVPTLGHGKLYIYFR